MLVSTEQKIVVPIPAGTEDLRVKVVDSRIEELLPGEVDGQVEITYDTSITFYETDYEKIFSLIEASKLSIDDRFLRRRPKTEKQSNFRKRVIAAILAGLEDFKAPLFDPSIDKNDNIYFCYGNRPGVARQANWWIENAPKYLPGISRIGTTAEHDAFLATLIKKGFATWEQVCDNSKEIGHYRDSEDAKEDFENTGSRPLGEFYDLGNTNKITLKGKEGSDVSIKGGNYYYDGYSCPLAEVSYFGDSSDFYSIANTIYCGGVGWIVLDA